MVTWVFWSLFKLLCWTLLFLVIVMVAPGIPPHNVKWNMLVVRICIRVKMGQVKL